MLNSVPASSVDLAGEPGELFRDFRRHTLELGAVDGDSGELHRRQHFDEGKLDLTINPLHLLFPDTALHELR